MAQIQMTDTYNTTQKASQIERLVDIMARLRKPETGCQWDLAQTFSTIAPFTIEEAYEVADAIENGDREQICDELGDLLLQVVFHSQIAEEEGSFTFDDVARTISDKMVRRHPHVFAKPSTLTEKMVRTSWEDIKAQERAEKTVRNDISADPSLLDGISKTLPAVVRAAKLQKRAARAGFDWPNLSQVINKLHEETEELRVEWDQNKRDVSRIKDEVGDILFVAANLARKVGVDPETALISCNNKFERRFRAVETALTASGTTFTDASLDEISILWDEAKKQEKIY